MPKLHQIVALVSGRKNAVHGKLTSTHRWNEKAIAGAIRTYSPINEDDEKLPNEVNLVQEIVNDKVKSAIDSLVGYWDLVFIQERANTKAVADLSIDGQILMKSVPVSALMFLEKQIIDIKTFVENLPTLPMDREWKFDDNKNCFVTSPVQNIRTKKIKKVLIKYEATENHPAQTEAYDADVTVGTYQTVYLSSAIPVKNKTNLLERISKLIDTIKMAREEANTIEAQDSKEGQSIVNYIFGNNFELLKK